jgi:hypothetical protein
LNESGICTLELYTKIFAEPARADRVAIKLRKVNYIMSCYYIPDSFKLVEEFHGQFKIGGGKKGVLLDWRENEKKKKKMADEVGGICHK